MRAIQDRVLVEPSFVEHVSAAGIFLGEGEMKDEGKVLAVGPGRVTAAGVTIPVAVNVGDTVLFANGAGAQVYVGRKRVLVLREQDIFAVQE